MPILKLTKDENPKKKKVDNRSTPSDFALLCDAMKSNTKGKKMNCEHAETKQVITATEVEVKCTGCKEVIHRRQRVLSSNLYAVARVGNDTEVQFMDRHKGPGAVGRYKNVPKSVHKKFLNASSMGVFQAKELKGEYDYEPLE